MEPKFKKDQRISLKKNITLKGRIDNIGATYGGYQFYDVVWDSGELEAKPEHELQNEIFIRNPWDLLVNNILSDYRDFSIATTLHKIRNTTSNTISTLQASRTIFMPYQYKPLVKFLKSDLKRILIADEVGLGKTIEAGHIMLELAARGNLRNVLVICTNSLRDKWKGELQEKFNFILKKYATKELIEDIKNDAAVFKKSIFGILNYEKCRSLDLQKTIEESGYRFDLLICDEAHKIRNSETDQHKGVNKIVENSDAVVFLTATPIMTSIDNLHNLIRVLDRESYDTYDIFNNAVQQNKPFIKAVSKLNAREPMPEIAEELHNAEVVQELTSDRQLLFSKQITVSDLFADDALYARARGNMLNTDNSVENRVRVQQDLIELNSLNHIYTRTRKKDVMSADDVVVRKPRTIRVPLSEEERELYDAIIEQYDDENNLGLIQKKRQISSCIVAFYSDKNELLSGIYDAGIPDSKFNAFRKLVTEVCFKNEKKLIVFAFFTKTLLYLQAKLKELEIVSEIIYGDIKDRTERIERFENNDKIKVLLSSEVGSEGLDLQFCDALVNYDLPWNPMVVEQRIGRIDRVGQKSKVINIYNLVLDNTIEERIHSRLYERINLFKESIGDMEEILGENEKVGDEITRGIENLYKTKLSIEEQNAMLDQMYKAIESEKQTLQKVKSELQDAFANDIHFQNEIDAITKNNRYITKTELLKYIQSIIRLHLSSFKLKEIEENLLEFDIPANSSSILFDFIEEYKDLLQESPELENAFRKFKTKFNGARKIPFTVDQKFAYKHKACEYISAFHPFINAATNFFSKNGYDKNRAHSIAINGKYVPENLSLQKGYYISSVFKITIERNFGDGKAKQLHFIHTALADLNGDQVKILSSDVSDAIQAALEEHSEQLFDVITFNEELVRLIRNEISIEIFKKQSSIKEDEEIKFLSGIRRRTEQEVSYINNRMRRNANLLREEKGIEAILKSELINLEEKKNALLENQKKASVHASHNIISVNLVQVI